MTISTALLVDTSGAIDQIATLMEAEWPGWYRSGGASARDDLVARQNRDRLPLGIVALAGEQAIGACALTVNSGGLITERTPWIGGLLVAPAFRRRGAASALLERGRREAWRLGHDALFALTATAHPLFRQQGWALIETVEIDGTAHGIYTSAAAGVEQADRE